MKHEILIIFYIRGSGVVVGVAGDLDVGCSPLSYIGVSPALPTTVVDPVAGVGRADTSS